MEPAALVAGAREHLVDRLPEPQCPITDSHLRGHGQPAGLDADQQFTPALRAFADPDMEAEQFLPALGRRPDDHQDTLGLWFHPRLQIDAISPNVDVAPRGEIPALPAIIFLLPARREPRNHAWRQVRCVRPEQCRQRLLKVTGGDAAQVKRGQ